MKQDALQITWMAQTEGGLVLMFELSLPPQ
jgi:hypothetical protein